MMTMEMNQTLKLLNWIRSSKQFDFISWIEVDQSWLLFHWKHWNPFGVWPTAINLFFARLKVVDVDIWKGKMPKQSGFRRVLGNIRGVSEPIPLEQLRFAALHY